MPLKKSLLVVLAMPLLFLACKTKSETVSNTDKTSYVDAVIRDRGDVALDGCGFVVDIDATIYMPENLDSKYHIDGLEVKIAYEETGRANCGLVKDMHLAMRIEAIEKK